MLIGLVNEATLCVANALLFMVCIFKCQQYSKVWLMKLHFVLLMLSCLWYVFIVLAMLIGFVNEATLCVANALLFMVCIYTVTNTHRSC